MREPVEVAGNPGETNRGMHRFAAGRKEDVTSAHGWTADGLTRKP